jgi:predicted MFS family arabinose efflux permease
MSVHLKNEDFAKIKTKTRSMFAGLTLANILGVLAGTALGEVYVGAQPSTWLWRSVLLLQ